MSFIQTAKTLADLLPLLSAISVLFSAIIVVMTMGMWSLKQEQITTWVKVTFGISALEKEIAELSGANRISLQPQGQTFVIEPVYTDSERIRLVITSRRTPLGVAWTFIEGTPIFTSVNGIRTTGSLLGSKEQFNQIPQRRIVDIVPPPKLPAGRTVLDIQLHYKNNDGGDHFEMLQYPVVFQVLPAKDRPEGEE